MKPAFLCKTDPERGAVWQTLFAAQAPGIEFRLWPEIGDPDSVRYLAAWHPPDRLLERFPRLEVLFVLGAGVDHVDLSGLPPDFPVVRLIDDGLPAGINEYVTAAVLTQHRDLFAYADQQRARLWQPLPTPLAGTRQVGVLGLGQLGRALLDCLAPFGFRRAGWSRTRTTIDGVVCFAGREELPDFLARTDFLVCLLPLTAETRGILNAELFGALPRGASLINVGRGGHVVAEDLLAALDGGHLSQAFLDVTEPEPLPADHPFWAHPKILITPHIAAVTQPETAAASVLANIRRHQSAERMDGLVNRTLGY